MALVAYSDDSDLGTDSEDGDEARDDVAVKTVDEKASVEPSTKISPPRVESGVDSIEDEDEDYPKNEPLSSLFSSVPAPVPVSSSLRAGIEEEDEVVDVPTVETWKVTQELKKQNTTVIEPPNSGTHQTASKEKKKVKIFLPSLSEFADDDEEEEENEPPRKKVKPSSSGSGLFSVLPEPKHQSAKEAGRSLVPHILTKRPSQPQKLKKKPPKAPMTAAVGGADHISDDDDESPAGTDFFSLSNASLVDHIRTAGESASNHVAAAASPNVEPIREMPKTTCSQSVDSPAVFLQHYQDHVEGPSNMVPNKSQLTEAITVSAAAAGGIDEATILRLAGKRGRTEAISFIDVNADDALLTRQEWMTKALSEEKPQHGFSKKREGLPTQKQKQKHQITYLAHQAKERELDLKNSWAQNKMTKMQSQAKYGF